MVKILSLVSLFTVSFPWLVFAGFEPVIPIRIYVQARIDPSGYAEPGVADSVMDLKNSIRKKSSWWQLVDSQERAQLVIEIVKREYQRGVSFDTTYNAATKQNEVVAKHEYRVFGELIVGSYRTELIGIDQDGGLEIGTWRGASGRILSQVEDWVKGNYNTLLQNTGYTAPQPNPTTPPAPTPELEQTASNIMRNQDVIALLDAGLDEDNMIQTIREAKETDFDLTAAGLKSLLNSGVSNKIIAEMRQKGSTKGDTENSMDKLDEISVKRIKRTMNDIGQIGTACEAYAVDENRYPVIKEHTVLGLVALLTPKYIRRNFPTTDAWGTPYHYKTSEDRYWIVSFGADGKPQSGLYSKEGVPLPNATGVTDDPNDDLIYSDGKFLRAPQFEFFFPVGPS